jgi:hypothetical protein
MMQFAGSQRVDRDGESHPTVASSVARAQAQNFIGTKKHYTPDWKPSFCL